MMLTSSSKFPCLPRSNRHKPLQQILLWLRPQHKLKQLSQKNTGFLILIYADIIGCSQRRDIQFHKNHFLTLGAYGTTSFTA